MAEVTKLTLAVDSTQVKTADADLQKMAASGKAAETAQAGLAAASRNTSQAVGAAAAAAAKTATAQAAVTSAARPAADALNKTAGAAKLTAMQAQQLSFQLNDLFVQIASGGSPLTALIQQGSQLSGTFGGVRAALSAVGGLFSVARVAIGGLAGATIGLGYAFLKGNQESAQLQRSLVLTGNAAGITEGQFNSLAQSISQATDTTIGSARDALAQLAASGRFSGEALAQAAQAVQGLSKATGRNAEDIAQDFIKASDSVTKFAEDSNRAYNFLTADQVRYVSALDDQGRAQEALAFVLAKLNDRLRETNQNLGLLERAYGGVKNAISGAIDAALAFGRDQTVEDKLAEVNRQLAELRSGNQTRYFFGPSAAELEAQRAALQGQLTTQRESAAEAAKRAQGEQAKLAFLKEGDKYLTREAQMAKELARNRELARQGGISAAELAKREAEVRSRFAVRGTGGGATLNVDKSKLDADLQVIRGALDGLAANYRSAEQVLEAVRSAGLADEKDYFDAKLAFIRLNQQANQDALRTENARLAAEIAAIEKKKGTQARVIELQTRIAENNVKLQRSGDDAAAREVINETQRQSALDATKRAYEQAEEAARQYLDTLRLSQQRELDGLGRGDAERDRQRGRQQIEDKYTQQRQQLELQRRAGQVNERQYAEELDRIARFQSAALSSYDDYYEALRAKQADANVGAQEAMANYLEDVRNVSKQVEDVMTNAFKGAEDVLVTFLTTGKLDFKSFANSLIADIARIQAKQILGSILGSGGGGGSGDFFSTILSSIFGGGKANGGPVQSGRLYEINERSGPGEILNAGGRQYLMPSRNGSVTPQGTASMGGEMSVVNNFHFAGPVDRRTQQQVAASAGRGVQRATSRIG